MESAMPDRRGKFGVSIRWDASDVPTPEKVEELYID
jgi:hypothetical protein